MRVTTLHTLADAPADALAFWERVLRAQDPAGALTGSAAWLALMAGDAAAVPLVVVRSAAATPPCLVLPGLRRPWALEARVGGRRLWSHPLTTLKAAGGDLLAEGLDATALADVLRDAFAALPDVTALWFEHVADTSRLALLEAAARRGGAALPLRLVTDIPHYRLTLPPTLAEALSRRSPKSLARLRAKGKALARDAGGEVRVVDVRTPDDWAPYAERIEALMNASWQAELLGHEFRLDRYRGTALRGWLRGFLLLAGDAAVAFTLYYQGQGTIVSAALGYDRRYARHSPGALLFLLTLERLYAVDLPRFLDFGEGDADYKRQWASEVRPVSALLLVRRRPDLVLAVRAYQAQRALVHGARRLLGRLRLERFLVRRLKRGESALPPS